MVTFTDDPDARRDGVARGKQLHDKRRSIAERDAKRDTDREIAEARRR